jgi:branched-chain amino acid transport system substrate-binding protein
MRRARLMVAAAIVFVAAASPARTEVLIGDASPLTGPVSWVGAQYLAGTELAVADLNAKGGVLASRCSWSRSTTRAIRSRQSRRRES